MLLAMGTEGSETSARVAMLRKFASASCTARRMFWPMVPGQGADVAGHLDHDGLHGLVGRCGHGGAELSLRGGIEVEQGAMPHHPL